MYRLKTAVVGRKKIRLNENRMDRNEIELYECSLLNFLKSNCKNQSNFVSPKKS